MAKIVEGRIKLQVKTGKASPSPPVGPALGQRGLNSMEFCKAFNDRTKDMEQDMPVTVHITFYNDKSFIFIVKSPMTSFLLRRAAGVDKGSAQPNAHKVGSITRAQLEEIARIKQPDLTAADMDAALRTIAGSARNMGIEVEGF